MLWKNSTRIISIFKKISLLNKANIYISNNDSFLCDSKERQMLNYFLPKFCCPGKGAMGLNDLLGGSDVIELCRWQKGLEIEKLCNYEKGCKSVSGSDQIYYTILVILLDLDSYNSRA